MLLFYANDGLLALPQTAQLQAALDVLTGLFDRYGLHTNVNKMVGIVFETYHMASGNSETAYDRIMMEVGPFFWERQQERVFCPDCAAYLAVGFLAAHHQYHCGTGWDDQWEATT